VLTHSVRIKSRCHLNIHRPLQSSISGQLPDLG